MTAKKQFWLVDATGTYALADGADQRDLLLPGGWAEAEEPTGEAFVWCRHPEIAAPAKFPASSLAEWATRGWEPGAPPSAADNLPPEVAPLAESTPPVTETKPKTTAAGGSTKEN